MLRILWTLYFTIIALQKVILPLYFFLLAITTAPEDTNELIQDSRDFIDSLNGNLAIDLLLLLFATLGLTATFGWGNWRLAIHRYYAKSRLKRLEDESRRIAEDIANTISQESQRRNSTLARSFEGRTHDSHFAMTLHEQDQRYLAKHMMEAASIISRLKEVGYWRPTQHYSEIGVAGATGFAAEATCKELYTAADRIKSDLLDGLLPLLTQPFHKL
jgi:type IV secretory pathway VirB2 component (pilin)